MTQTDEREASSSHAESRIGFATLFIPSSFPTRLTFRLPIAGLKNCFLRTEQNRENETHDFIPSRKTKQPFSFLSRERARRKKKEKPRRDFFLLLSFSG